MKKWTTTYTKIEGEDELLFAGPIVKARTEKTAKIKALTLGVTLSDR